MFDVVIAGDFAAPGDVPLRALFEARVQHGLGLRTGLLHLAPNARANGVSADVQRAVREGVAHVVDASVPVRTQLLVVHAPMTLLPVSQAIGNITAETVCVVHDRSPRPGDMWRLFALMRGRMVWAPTNRWVRAHLSALSLPVAVEEIDWRPPVIAGIERSASRPGGRRAVIGLINIGSLRHWPEGSNVLTELLPIGEAMELRFLGAPPPALTPQGLPPHWHVDDPNEMGIERFLDRIDALVYAPHLELEEVPDAAIAAALAKRRLVVTRPHLRRHLGEGPLYSAPDAMAVHVREALSQPDLDSHLDRAAGYASHYFAPAFHAERLARLLGHIETTVTASRAVTRSPPKVLFLASNGVGLGHVTRLLAIANRAAGRFQPVFVSHAQALPILRGYGFYTEYIPSLSDTAADPQLWDRWLKSELSELIYAHDAQAIVFDGNNPFPGIVGAALSQPPCKLVWVRRGMNGPVASPHLNNAEYFDLIIEPGELAGERDTGATAARKYEALQVPPVTLLDTEDLDDRQTAAAALGLDPSRPAVLVQLGAGAHRDVIKLIDAVVRGLKGFDGLQIAIAEWTNSSAPLSLWPDTVVISGFPLSRYARAFDFSISAAGYNSFHESMRFGIPTIFLAAEHSALDDQRARARYAQDMGAGFDLSEDQLGQLPTICTLLLDTRARDVMVRKCAALSQANGAGQAATAIARLLGAA